MLNENNRLDALRNFDGARRKAKRKQITDLIIGRQDTLLPFEVIRDAFRLQNPLYAGVQQIPIDKVVGSIGRYHDFTREFLPLNDSMAERWVGVESLAHETGWPPIDVYQVDDIYFVRDGNHRTAIARQMGNTTIEANVWQFKSDISIDANATTTQILLDLGKQMFEERTQIVEIDPDYDIVFTSPGHYSELLAQIENLRQKLSLLDKQERTFSQTVRSWYELVYLPAVDVIESTTLLQDFPGRTNADLFAWLSRHRTMLREHFDTYTDLPGLAEMLAAQYREGGLTKVARQIGNLLGSETLPTLTEPVTPADPEIENATILQDFPGRTKAELFAWLARHRLVVSEDFDTDTDAPGLAEMLIDQYREGNITKADPEAVGE